MISYGFLFKILQLNEFKILSPKTIFFFLLFFRLFREEILLIGQLILYFLLLLENEFLSRSNSTLGKYTKAIKQGRIM